MIVHNFILSEENAIVYYVIIQLILLFLNVKLLSKGSIYFMPHTLKAIYHNGRFVLRTPYDLPKGFEVELFIQSPQIMPPPINNPETSPHFLTSLIKQIQQNPIPSDTPQLTRDMLHEHC